MNAIILSALIYALSGNFRKLQLLSTIYTDTLKIGITLF